MAGDQGYTKQEQQARHIAALKRERAGYVAKGKDARVAAVDAELKRLGVKPEPDSPATDSDSSDSDDAKDDAHKQAPQDRSTQPRQTTK